MQDSTIGSSSPSITPMQHKHGIDSDNRASLSDLDRRLAAEVLPVITDSHAHVHADSTNPIHLNDRDFSVLDDETEEDLFQDAHDLIRRHLIALESDGTIDRNGSGDPIVILQSEWGISWDNSGDRIVAVGERLRQLCQQVAEDSVDRSHRSRRRDAVDDQKASVRQSQVLRAENALQEILGRMLKGFEGLGWQQIVEVLADQHDTHAFLQWSRERLLRTKPEARKSIERLLNEHHQALMAASAAKLRILRAKTFQNLINSSAKDKALAQRFFQIPNHPLMLPPEAESPELHALRMYLQEQVQSHLKAVESKLLSVEQADNNGLIPILKGRLTFWKEVQQALSTQVNVEDLLLVQKSLETERQLLISVAENPARPLQDYIDSTLGRAVKLFDELSDLPLQLPADDPLKLALDAEILSLKQQSLWKRDPKPLLEGLSRLPRLVQAMVGSDVSQGKEERQAIGQAILPALEAEVFFLNHLIFTLVQPYQSASELAAAKERRWEEDVAKVSQNNAEAMIRLKNFGMAVNRHRAELAQLGQDLLPRGILGMSDAIAPHGQELRQIIKNFIEGWTPHLDSIKMHKSPIKALNILESKGLEEILAAERAAIQEIRAHLSESPKVLAQRHADSVRALGLELLEVMKNSDAYTEQQREDTLLSAFSAPYSWIDTVDDLANQGSTELDPKACQRWLKNISNTASTAFGKEIPQEIVSIRAKASSEASFMMSLTP